ncbi:MAG: YfcE family phosphodiesterase [Bacteroidales bacterium]|nr:YfcE family phosphodiesterase [Bacteroidales bacterium]
MTRIGVISDTHGYLNPRLKELMADRDEIWHCGDIGSMAVLNELRRWGKTIRAVYGNIDDAEMRYNLNSTERFTVEGIDVVMMHIGGYPGKYSAGALVTLAQNAPKMLVCGHSHILKVIYDKKYECLHVNPGACGRYGIHNVMTALRFAIDNGEVKDMEIIELGQRK